MELSWNVTSALLRIRLSIGKKIYGYRLEQPVVRVSTNRLIKGPCETTVLAALGFEWLFIYLFLLKTHDVHTV